MVALRATTVTGCVFAALVLATTPFLSKAGAGEAYGEEYSEESYTEHYDDVEDGVPSRYSGSPHVSYKDDPIDDVADKGGSIKDGYPVPMPPPDDHAAAPPPPPRASRPRRVERVACLESWEIERRLEHHGWADIRAVATRRGVTRIRARRIDTGRPFLLRVDRCSGDLITARPRLRAFGGFRHPRPWRERRWAGGWRY